MRAGLGNPVDSIDTLPYLLAMPREPAELILRDKSSAARLIFPRPSTAAEVGRRFVEFAIRARFVHGSDLLPPRRVRAAGVACDKLECARRALTCNWREIAWGRSAATYIER